METSGLLVALSLSVSTVGRGPGVDVTLHEASVSPLHAEVVRRGLHLYVCDLGLSQNGTRVNGWPVGRRPLANGDVLSFGLARVQVEGLPSNAGQDRDAADPDPGALRLVARDMLTAREVDVLTALCRPRTDDAFDTPASVADIAAELNVRDTGVKAHLLRLYAKFDIAVGGDRRSRLANEVLRTGLVPLARHTDPGYLHSRGDPPQPGGATPPPPPPAPAP